MAKKAATDKKPAKTTPAKRQQQFEGNGFPKKPPKAVLDARDNYLQAMRSSTKAAAKKSQREQELVEMMHKHKIERLKLDDEAKFIELNKSEKPKIKTIPAEDRKKREARETAAAK